MNRAPAMGGGSNGRHTWARRDVRGRVGVTVNLLLLMPSASPIPRQPTCTRDARQCDQPAIQPLVIVSPEVRHVHAYRRFGGCRPERLSQVMPGAGRTRVGGEGYMSDAGVDGVLPCCFPVHRLCTCAKMFKIACRCKSHRNAKMPTRCSARVSAPGDACHVRPGCSPREGGAA